MGNFVFLWIKECVLECFTNISVTFYAGALQVLKECSLGKQHRAAAGGKTFRAWFAAEFAPCFQNFLGKFMTYVQVGIFTQNRPVHSENTGLLCCSGGRQKEGDGEIVWN